MKFLGNKNGQTFASSEQRLFKLNINSLSIKTAHVSCVAGSCCFAETRYERHVLFPSDNKPVSMH